MNTHLRSLIEGLSYALDVAEKSRFSHSKHVAYNAYTLGKELGLKGKDLENLYYAALLHDIGASNTYYIEEHCIKGRDIVLHLPMDSIISEYIYYHHENYIGMGPFGKKGDEILLQSQIICISDLFDKEFGGREQVTIELFEEIDRWVINNSKFFSPMIVNHFRQLIEKEFVLLDYYNHEFNNVIQRRVKIEERQLGYEEVILFARAFSQIIDSRSPFTFEHSMGIAGLVKKITHSLGYTKEIQNKMYLAALLHDIGKLVISNEIIDKPGKLDDKERFEINKHTYYTRWILEQIDGFEEVTDFAANHHERPDGNGYPFHFKEEELGEPDKVMAICDIYQALTEDRPYRTRMPEEKVWSIMEDMAENHTLDKKLLLRIKEILVA